MGDTLAFLTYVLFGTVGLILLVDVLDSIWAALRRRLRSAPGADWPKYGAGFNLRRTGSYLRRRYNQRAPLKRFPNDPYED